MLRHFEKKISNIKDIKGIRIKTFNAVMIAAACLVFAALLYNTALLPGKYETLSEHTEEYVECGKNASELREASDYLTEQVRLYAINMNIDNMNNYFNEVNVTKRRNHALENLEAANTSASLKQSLEAALESSNDLMKTEAYSMKLISLANGYSDDVLPEEVRSIQLKAEDMRLSPEEMIEKGRSMVFDSGYQNAKALIYSHLDHFIDGTMTHLSEEQELVYSGLGDAITLQSILIVVLFLINIITFIAIYTLIVRPLTIHVRRIEENGMLEIMGAYEFKYLAITYNDIYELNAANQEVLKKKAERDSLTGLMNRGTFENLKRIFKESQSPLALLIVDVDKFKTVNDTYGHSVGDKVLIRVGNTLEKTFRSTDKIARIGGDEFAVVLTDIRKEDASAIREKAAEIGKVLSQSEYDISAITLSIGAAFSDQGFHDKLFEQADKALYEAKESGRNRICIYEET